jgi:hypothetical protein
MANQGLLSYRRAVVEFSRRSVDCVFQHALANSHELHGGMVWSLEHEGGLVASESSKPCWEISNKEFLDALDFPLFIMQSDDLEQQMGERLRKSVSFYA